MQINEYYLRTARLEAAGVSPCGWDAEVSSEGRTDNRSGRVLRSRLSCSPAGVAEAMLRRLAAGPHVPASPRPESPSLLPL